MRIQHVNSGTKAKWKTKGTILQLTVPGVEPIEIDLNEELQDVAVTVDVSLNSGFTALESRIPRRRSTRHFVPTRRTSPIITRSATT